MAIGRDARVMEANRKDADWQQTLALRGMMALVLGLCLWWGYRWWNYPPVVEYDNLKYIQLLRTAVSSQRPDWVAKVTEAIELRCRAAEMSPAERAHFDRVLAQANAGQWEAAHRLCWQFEEAQLSRRRPNSTRRESESHRHDHGQSLP